MKPCQTGIRRFSPHGGENQSSITDYQVLHEGKYFVHFGVMSESPKIQRDSAPVAVRECFRVFDDSLSLS